MISQKQIRKVLCLVLLTSTFISPARADQAQAIVVIDTGVNTSLFPKIITEYCTVEYTPCSNGKQTMEGPGAANIPVSTVAAVNHGNEMMSIISRINPNANLIPIQITSVTKNGNLSLYSNASVKMALDWVVSNRVKYNITVVNVSVGAIIGSCYVTPGIAEDVAVLKANNVAVIAAAGNDSNRNAMHSIACLPDVVSVGATDNPAIKAGVAWDPNKSPYIARYSNGTAKTSVYTNARWFVQQTNGQMKFRVGTSNSTAALSGWWSLNRKATWEETYSLLVSKTTTAKNEFITGRYLLIP